MSINTYQDSLGHWHATVTDSDGNTVASTPVSNQYGFDTEDKARQAAQRIINRYERSYEPTEN